MELAELAEIVRRSDSRTLFAQRMREVLGIPEPKGDGHDRRARVRDKGAKARKYRGARKLMAQRHGVRIEQA